MLLGPPTVTSSLAIDVGDAVAALPDFEAAIQLDPSKAESHFYLGQIQDRAGHDSLDAYETSV